MRFRYYAFYCVFLSKKYFPCMLHRLTSLMATSEGVVPPFLDGFYGVPWGFPAASIVQTASHVGQHRAW